MTTLLSPPTDDESYDLFCQLTTGYRMYFIINQAVQTGLIDLLEGGALPAEELLRRAGVRWEEGSRFLELLVATRLLIKQEDHYQLSSFSQNYLSRQSPACQRGVLAFEPVLMENWSKLGTVLHEGQGALIEEKSTEEYSQRLDLFQRAMGDAAAVRSVELWSTLPDLPEHGNIIDIGAGDGVYLDRFLERYPGWQAVACDLPDVCQRLQQRDRTGRIRSVPCNILDQQEMNALVAHHRATARVVLLSNLCHCYGHDDNLALLQQAGALLADDGVVVLHDFFRDSSTFGALYDLHLMVNTYNGRCFSTGEIEELLQQCGMRLQSTLPLPSGSIALLGVKQEQL